MTRVRNWPFFFICHNSLIFHLIYENAGIYFHHHFHIYFTFAKASLGMYSEWSQICSGCKTELSRPVIAKQCTSVSQMKFCITWLPGVQQGNLCSAGYRNGGSMHDREHTEQPARTGCSGIPAEAAPRTDKPECQMCKYLSWVGELKLNNSCVLCIHTFIWKTHYTLLIPF